MPGHRADVLREAERLSGLLEADRFRGFDPYDALASPILPSLRHNSAREACASR